MAYPYNGILFDHKREWGINICYDMYSPWKCCSKCKKAKYEGSTCMISFIWNLYEMSTIGKSIETGNTLVDV